jgi:hypothetical protein
MVTFLSPFLAVVRSEPPAAKGADRYQWRIVDLHLAICELKMAQPPKWGKSLTHG